MERLTLEDLERDADAYDAAVLASGDIDRFCSASEWAFAARAAWSRDAPAWIARGEGGYAAFVEHRDAGGARMLLGFDVAWGFACPLVGRDAAALARGFAEAVDEAEWDAILLPGIREGSGLMLAAIDAFGDRHEVRQGPTLRRWVAGLSGGVEGYLSRRSAKLRENLRRARRRALAEGISFEPADAGDALARATAVEERSWKGAERTGLLVPDMRVFYEGICARLAARGRLRATFARQRGEDVGYILGGVRDGTYRGFQFSYDERLRAVSVGSLLQLEQIAALCREGVATYDLGIDLPYKARWADGAFDTVTLAVIRRWPWPPR